MLLSSSKAKPYAEAISTEELSAILSTVKEANSREDIKRLLQAASSGSSESLLHQVGTIAGLLKIVVGRYPKLFAKLLRTGLLSSSQTKPYAEGISTDKLSAVLSTVTGTLSRADLERLVRTTILRTQKKGSL